MANKEGDEGAKVGIDQRKKKGKRRQEMKTELNKKREERKQDTEEWEGKQKQTHMDKCIYKLYRHL